MSSQGSKTTAPAAKRPRTDNFTQPRTGTLAVPSPSTSTNSSGGLALPQATAPLPANAAPSTSSKQRQSPSTSGGLALPTPGWSAQQHPIAIDPALQSISSPAPGPSSSTPTPAPPNTSYNPSHYVPQQTRPPYASPYPPAYTYPPPQGYAYPPPYAHYYTSAPGQPPYATQPYPKPLQHATTYQPYSQSRVQTPSAATPTSTLPPAAAQPNPLDSSDPNELNDAIGSAGVDIRAEQDALSRSHEFYQPQQNVVMRDDRSKKQAFIDPSILAPTMRSIASKHNVTKVPEDSINYAALALRERLLGLITSSIHARDHRLSSNANRPPGMYSDGTTPMWSQVIRRDITKQLRALEKVDREEEARIRRERREKIENGGYDATGTPNDGNNEDGEGSNAKKRKRKEVGPGVTAKTMSEDAKKKAMDAVVGQAIGSKRFAWMTTGASASSSPATPVRKTSTIADGTSAPSAAPATGAASSPLVSKPLTGGGWARAPLMQAQAMGVGGRATAEDDEARQVTLRDVEFAIDKEKGHGGGRGSARGWT